MDQMQDNLNFLWIVVGTVVAAYALHTAFRAFRPAKPPPKWTPPEAPPKKRPFTLKELSEYDGKHRESVYVAVRGGVYDVSGSKRFYGPGGVYECFGGRDASRGFARNDFSVRSPDETTLDPLDDLNAIEAESLNDWEFKFRSKYHHIGWLVESHEVAHEAPSCEKERTGGRDPE